MNFLKKFLEYAIFSGTIFLAFLLVFEQFLYIPGLVRWIGHWHPLILHFPIVLILVTIFQYWRKDAYFDWFLSITTFLTLITAITGFLLSLEGGSKGNLILTHQWLGVAVCYVMAVWFWLNQRKPLRIILPIFIQSVLIILIVLTGHFGGMVTHGKDFLALTKEKNHNATLMPDNPNIFNHIIQPILDKKCVSCHNPDKSKGELVLSDFASIKTGGESGKAIDQQNFMNSNLLKRISLPLEEEDHMPPKDEKQLTDDEMILLSEWIKNGASDSLQFNDLEVSEQSYALVNKLIDQMRNDKWNDLPDLSDDEIAQLSSNYVSINRLFSRSNALQVIVYPHKGYNNRIFGDLKPVSGNIVELNLSGLPVNEQELEFAGSCINLEKLNISNTPIGDDGILPLKKLKKLNDLKIYNTSLTDDALNIISEIPDLSNLFVYNTGITQDGVNKFLEEKNDVIILLTANQAKDFKSVLPTPTVKPRTHFFYEPFKIKLDHPLHGINLFYTVNGSTPDEKSDDAQDSIEIVEHTHLKYYAAKTGWESSPVDSMRFFKTIKKPDNYSLVHSPDLKYLGRGEKLLFDLKKGPVNFGDSAWMAFREDRFILNCEWTDEVRIGSVVISSIVQTDPYLFPPESMVIRGGTEKSSLKILGQFNPKKLEERSERYFDFYECQFDPIKVRFIEITVQPLQSIPMWHQGKGEKGWFFIDEVVFESADRL